MDIVRKASNKLNNGKGDPVFSFCSDAFNVNLPVLLEYKMWLFRSFLVHAHIPEFLHLSRLLPNIKDKLGSIISSKNYRSVCIT